MHKPFLKGLSLVEMLVVIAIFTMVMGGVSLYFWRIWDSQRFSLESAQAQLLASEGVMNTLGQVRNMRQSDAGSYPIVSAAETDIVFYGDYDGDGDVERLHYYLDADNDELLLGVREPVAGAPPTYASGDGSTSVVAENVRNGNGSYPEAIFSYYDNVNGSVATPVSTGDLSDVRMVKMNIYVDINPSLSPDPVHFESFASIRNLNEYDRPN